MFEKKRQEDIQMKRDHTRRRQKGITLSFPTIIAIFTLLFILGGVLLGSSWSEAKQSSAAVEYPVYKYYTSIELEEGDTLWSIADTYATKGCQSKNDYIAEVKELNQIDENDIHSGQHLLIPYYSEKNL